MTQEWSNAVDDGQYVATVFFDLKKAFDRVWHQGLLAKLRAAGIKGAAHEWLVNFLTDRVQVTVVNGKISTSARFFAGVPQGAILSPLLFSVYMNDIPFPRTTNLFADDTSSYIIDSVPSLLESKLQERTNSLSIWFSKWHLTVNPTKSAVIRFHSRKMQAVNIRITVDSHQVPQVPHHRHLAIGVTFSDTLGWTSHVDTIVRAASAKVGFLHRLRKRLNPLIMRQLYITCIRPSLEYASNAWGGLTRRGEEKLERCNRSAARLIANISPSADIPCEIVLARAGLPTMASRRKAFQVSLAQAAVRGRLPDHLLATFSSWTVPASVHITVQVDGSKSLPKPISAGVPQGSHLGPVLFVVFINDLPSHTKPVATELYADDALLHQLHPRCEELSLMPLQNAVEAAENWALSWHGRFGSAKTKMMTSLQNISPEHKTIHIENEAIKIVNSHKHLVLNLTADLDWHDHINQLLLGASQRAGLLRWMSKDLRPSTVQQLYVYFLRPKLEYLIVTIICGHYILRIFAI